MGKEMNTWMFYNNDIILMSSDPEQLEMANQWIVRLKEAIRDQMEEENNGRTNTPDQSEGITRDDL
jgi:hypothetical protein